MYESIKQLALPRSIQRHSLLYLVLCCAMMLSVFMLTTATTAFCADSSVAMANDIANQMTSTVRLVAISVFVCYLVYTGYRLLLGDEYALKRVSFIMLAPMFLKLIAPELSGDIPEGVEMSILAVSDYMTVIFFGVILVAIIVVIFGKFLITYLQSRTEQKKATKVKVQIKKKTSDQGEGTRVPSSSRSPQVQAILDCGNAYIAQIRKYNDDIPGKEVSAKIDQLENNVRRIFQRVEKDPKIIPDVKRMMDYYLPMAVKFLKAYADMDAQMIRGKQIQSSKKEIEKALDTLNRAFEKLLDSLFADTAMDISSDISVLNVLLAQEGLAEDDFAE